MQKTAILFGATGLIGGALLRQLLDNPAYGRVIAVTRRNLPVEHPNFVQLIADLQSITKIEKQLIADDVFCCLGTTKKKTPDLAAYYQIDHDYPLAVAQLTKRNGARAFLLVSAIGANPRSANFYLRMKGETERDISAVNFDGLHIFRPSLLTGQRQEHRALESFSERVFNVINPLLVGRMKRYRSIPATAVAKAMNSVAQRHTKGRFIYYWDDIKNVV
ncbi:oxidoreductase [Parapedobacter sp. ISTM3]|uniref:oxidoreductase n=1 Tax=Parapedobacter sp. ISTM3 TaxID=2800130 RepID=UPI001905AC9D|nr:oxidoreductase [Parapedobacter sp. ISTM3]MBK1440651.1 oxidoreductase [Parapedobacter sp. ISTM3]